jgi:hypothetical protein
MLSDEAFRRSPESALSRLPSLQLKERRLRSPNSRDRKGVLGLLLWGLFGQDFCLCERTLTTFVHRQTFLEKLFFLYLAEAQDTWRLIRPSFDLGKAGNPDGKNGHK